MRIFLVSLFSTLCVAALMLGIMEVDYQSRRIGFGDEKTLLYQITGKNPNFSCIRDKL